MGPQANADYPMSCNLGDNLMTHCDADFRSVFKSCPVGMVSVVTFCLKMDTFRYPLLNQFASSKNKSYKAISNLGGTFMDCNDFFCRLTGFAKDKLCSQTVFDLIDRRDLQAAFDAISSLIIKQQGDTLSKPIILRGCFGDGADKKELGLHLSVINGKMGNSHRLCFTLTNSPSTHASGLVRPSPFSAPEMAQLPTSIGPVDARASPIKNSSSFSATADSQHQGENAPRKELESGLFFAVG